MLVEGPELSVDHSFYLVDQCPQLREVEQGIPIAHFIRLNLEP